MVTAIETRIAEGLFARLAELVLDPVLPIAYPNADFTPPVDNRWLKVTEIPAPALAFALAAGGTRDHVGVLQVDVLWPQGTGMAAPRQVADALIAHFKPGTVIYRDGAKIKITQAWIGQKLDDPPRMSLPVSLRYRAFG